MAIALVAGLGNPGAQYAGTRHNVGFDVLDIVAQRRGVKWTRNRQFLGEIASSGGLHLLKPLTFMNLSGESVGRLARYYKIEPSQILVVVDDIALDLGRLRIRFAGSAGGHNGLKSVIEHLGTDQFPRLRIGVGAVGGGQDVVDHVLSGFTPDEREKIKRTLDRAADAVEHACSSGLEPAMNFYNQAPKEPA